MAWLGLVELVALEREVDDRLGTSLSCLLRVGEWWGESGGVGLWGGCLVSGWLWLLLMRLCLFLLFLRLYAFEGLLNAFVLRLYAVVCFWML